MFINIVVSPSLGSPASTSFQHKILCPSVIDLTSDSFWHLIDPDDPFGVPRMEIVGICPCLIMTFSSALKVIERGTILRLIPSEKGQYFKISAQCILKITRIHNGDFIGTCHSQIKGSENSRCKYIIATISCFYGMHSCDLYGLMLKEFRNRTFIN
jgi:hypothetical protein